MASKGHSVPEGMPTFPALIRAFASMNEKVLLEGVKAREAAATVRAGQGGGHTTTTTGPGPPTPL